MTVSAIAHPRILLIDSYDSFTYNLASLFRRAIPNCSVHIIKNDKLDAAELISYLDVFSAIIVGPGPGSPDNPDDIGIVKDLWNIPNEHLLPVFGVCLGLQSLALESGARLKRLNVVKHGQISKIFHQGSDIFKGVGEIEAVRYHSLYVELQGDEDVEPLAWADDGEENGRVIMAVRHITNPFWAVQYHPESVCSRGGEEVLRNFWRLAKNWSAIKHRSLRPWNSTVEAVIGPSWPTIQLSNVPRTPSCCKAPTVASRVVEIPGLATTSVCEALGVSEGCSDFVLLDSAAQPGRFSIIGCLTPHSLKITYFVPDPHVQIYSQGKRSLANLDSSDIWTWLAGFMRTKKACGGIEDVPFWGGLVGFLSYELGVQSLSAAVASRKTERSEQHHPDVNLVFVERSVVLDSVSGKVYVQSLKPDDNVWLTEMTSLLQRCAPHDVISTSAVKRRRRDTPIRSPVVTLPDRQRYISRINKAKEYLFAGDSYELCLTAPTRISVPRVAAITKDCTSSSWELYKVLRTCNPAPHSAYLRLHPSTLLSSSPERFLSFSRPPHTTCQLRPIKGTVRKAPGITRAVAEQALAGSAKEVAENLMIVDLIRHDLHGVVGENVKVKQFCKVEEYETVWQLVSVIEGKLPDEDEINASPDLGWEVLRRSLPPGSMTGAPKKRSVEILHALEDHDRGIYSGVFGYWCVGGSGDWSVTIRSCFKFDSSNKSGKSEMKESDTRRDSSRELSTAEEWTLGAGGAITALSDPEAEWDEMIAKVESVLRAFDNIGHFS
ncbi:hypothetical protein AcV7_000891 [Taiwanofungus camphoratus]|nr:hypothetical protein AcV7_000891 [Antrodia cinnamomea]